MPIRLLSLILGYFLISSPFQFLNASDNEEELKGPRMGTRAPHSSLATGQTLEVAELQRKLASLEKETKRQKTSSKPSSSSSRDKTKPREHKSSKDSNKSSSHHDKPSKRVYESKRGHKEASPHNHKTLDGSPENQPTVTSSTPQIPSEAKESPALNQTQGNEAAIISPKPRSTLDLATFMPAPKSTASSSSSSKVNKSSGRKDKQKQESGEEIADRETSSKKAIPKKTKEKVSSVDTFYASLGIKMPQVSKTLFAPKQLSPFYIMLALAAGTRLEEKVHDITKQKESVKKQNKIYIPELDQIAGYKMMQTGTLETLKTNLFYDDFSELADVTNLLKLIRITGIDSIENIKMEVFMDKAKALIKKLEPEYLKKTKITTQFGEIDKREDNTLGGDQFKGNFGVYNFYKEGILIPGIQVRLTFSKLK